MSMFTRCHPRVLTIYMTLQLAEKSSFHMLAPCSDSLITSYCQGMLSLTCLRCSCQSAARPATSAYIPSAPTSFKLADDIKRTLHMAALLLTLKANTNNTRCEGTKESTLPFLKQSCTLLPPHTGIQ